MEPAHLVNWLVGASCTLSIVRVLRAGRGTGRGWLVICSVLLAALLAVLLVDPELAALVVGPAWAVFLLLPSLGSRLLTWQLMHRHYKAGLATSRVLAVLHPYDGWREQPDLVQVLGLHDEGRADEASALLEGKASLDSPLGRTALVLDTRARGSWREFTLWVEGSANPAGLLSELTTLSAYLRALGETGRRADMVATWVATAPQRARWSSHLIVHIMRMHLVALTGRVDAVGAQFDGPLSQLSADTRAFWVASAQQVADRPEEADALLAGIGSECGVDLQREAERRRAVPLTPLGDDELDDRAREVLDELETDADHERRFAVMGPGGRYPLRATWILAAVLLGVFGAELPGGAENLDNLVSMGALVVPTDATPGEWWRRITAGLLHFGVLHVSLNVLTLLYLGTFLERAWGWRRFLVCYVLAWLVSTGLFPELIDLPPGEVRTLVGASGGIMGLLGALLGHTLAGSLHRRTRGVMRQLGFLALLVAFQLTFDQLTPVVSSLCHALGLATGFLVGLVIGRRMAREAEGAPSPG